jgi:hypothetical protein
MQQSYCSMFGSSMKDFNDNHVITATHLSAARSASVKRLRAACTASSSSTARVLNLRQSACNAHTVFTHSTGAAVSNNL